MAITWSESADKHGVGRDDALHAMLHHYLHVPAFDDPRVPGATRPDWFIGPLIEVMTETVPPRGIRIFHVMIARQKFLALLDER